MVSAALIFAAALQPGSPGTALLPVRDTFIDPSSPDANFGREPSLVLGNGRVALLDFPAIQWQKYEGKRVKSAELVLTFSRQPASVPISVSAVKTLWGEGDGRSLRFDRPDPKLIPWGGATWKNSRRGRDGNKWQADGAKGASDSTAIEGVTADIQGQKLLVKNLAAAVQAQIDRPDQNHGFRLESTADVAFYSSEWSADRPQLVIEWEDAKPAGADLALITFLPDLSKPLRTGESSEFTAIVKNVGDTDAPSARLVWTDGAGVEHSADIPGPIAPNATKTIKTLGTYRADMSDPRKFATHARIVADTDANPGNNFLHYFGGGLTVAFEASPEQMEQLRASSPGGDTLLLYQATIAKFNNYVLPFSRFIQTPEGTFERLNLTLNPMEADIRVNLVDGQDANSAGIEKSLARSLSPLGATYATPPSDAAPWPSKSMGLGWLSDTRDDGLRIPGLDLPALGFNSESGGVPLYEHGLLSRQEAFAMQANLGKRGKDRVFPWKLIQPGILINTVGTGGDRLAQAVVGIFRPGEKEPILVGNTGASGFVYFSANQSQGNPLFADLETSPKNAWYRVELTNGFDSASTWLPAALVLDWYARGNDGLANVELRFLLPPKPIDRSQNLASGKLVVDSNDSFPAQLNALVDGNPATGVDLFPGQWIEVDLARDRSIGQVLIDLSAGTLDKFDILLYGTSQSVDAAVRWVSVNDGGYLADVYGAKSATGSQVPVVAPSRQGRYLRIVSRSAEKVTINELTVNPVK